MHGGGLQWPLYVKLRTALKSQVQPQVQLHTCFMAVFKEYLFLLFGSFSIHIQMYPDLSTLQSQIFRSGRVVLFQQRRLD